MSVHLAGGGTCAPYARVMVSSADMVVQDIPNQDITTPKLFVKVGLSCLKMYSRLVVQTGHGEALHAHQDPLTVELYQKHTTQCV